MELKAGLKLRSTADATEVVVIRPGGGPGELTCGGHRMVPAADTVDPSGVVPGHEGQTLVGKRYTDEEGGIELLCTKPGGGALAWEGRALVLRTAKPLPSSD